MCYKQITSISPMYVLRGEFRQPATNLWSENMKEEIQPILQQAEVSQALSLG